MQEELFIDLWQLFMAHTTDKELEEAAFRFVEIFEDCGIDVSRFEEVHGRCSFLDEAIEEKTKIEEDPDDEYDVDY